MKSTENPIPNTKEIRQIERMADKLARISNQSERDHFTDRLKSNVIDDPTIVFSILHVMLKHHAPNDDNESLSSVFKNLAMLLSDVLTEIRYSAERGRAKALKAVDDLQHYFEAHLFQTDVALRVQNCIVDALYQSGLKLDPALREKSDHIYENPDDAQFADKSKIEQLNGILERLAADSKGYFEFHDNLMAQMSALPLREQMAWITAMLLSKNRKIGPFKVLMLLHPESAIRKKIPELYERLDLYDTMTPKDLRRMSGIRNWLPQDERQAIDEIIQKIQQCGIKSAPMLVKKPQLAIHASFFDGSGGQGIWILERASGSKVLKNKYNMTAILYRQSEGVHEIWGESNFNKRRFKDLQDHITHNTDCIPVNLEYIRKTSAHFIHKKLERNAPPPMLFVFVAEMIGHYPLPQPIDFNAVLESMEASIDPKYLSSEYIEKSLEKSGKWMNDDFFAQGWFEDHDDVDQMLKKAFPTFPNIKSEPQILKAIMLILENVLEPKRTIWADRMLLMAIWAFSSIDKYKRLGKEFAILSRSLYRGKPLEDIPLMLEIARLTFQSALRRASRLKKSHLPF